MNPLTIGYIGCIIFLFLLFCGMPVAIAMGLAGVIGFASIVSWQGALSMMNADLYDTFSNYSFAVIPLFVFMGQISFHSGISRRLYHAAYCWMGWMKGGMAMATVGACAAFSAVCGSGPATAATMAAVALPEMRRYKYDTALATGTVAAGGGLGMLIPPSVVFIVYGILTGQSIGKLFVAGILPGLLCVLLFCIVIAVKCHLNPALGPQAQPMPWSVRFKSLLGAIEMLLLFTLVVGGIYLGWFTPNEGASVGAAGSVLLTIIRRQCSWAMLRRAAQETLQTSCMILIIVACATMFGHFLGVSQIPQVLTRNLVMLHTVYHLHPYAILTIIMLFYLFIGLFVDSLALVLLTVPILGPIVFNELGFDAIWFGVIIVIITQIGVITPPVGMNVFVVNGADRGTPLSTIFRGSLPFLLALIAAFFLLLFFPQIATWLPNR
jgi:tripartite ATP-independent transporter DctM subunit